MVQIPQVYKSETQYVKVNITSSGGFSRYLYDTMKVVTSKRGSESKPPASETLCLLVAWKRPQRTTRACRHCEPVPINQTLDTTCRETQVKWVQVYNCQNILSFLYPESLAYHFFWQVRQNTCKLLYPCSMSYNSMHTENLNFTWHDHESIVPPQLLYVNFVLV